MTIGDYRKLTEDLPEDTPMVAWCDDCGVLEEIDSSDLTVVFQRYVTTGGIFGPRRLLCFGPIPSRNIPHLKAVK